MPDHDITLSPVQTNVGINDCENEEFIPGTLNIYAAEVDPESNSAKTNHLELLLSKQKERLFFSPTIKFLQ